MAEALSWSSIQRGIPWGSVRVQGWKEPLISFAADIGRGLQATEAGIAVLPWRTGFHLLGPARLRIFCNKQQAFSKVICIFLRALDTLWMLNHYKKRFFKTVQCKMVSSAFQTHFTGMLWRYTALELLTVMNPSFSLEDTTNCCQSRIWLLHSRVGPDKCKTMEYKLSCGLSEAKVPELIKA